MLFEQSLDEGKEGRWSFFGALGLRCLIVDTNVDVGPSQIVRLSKVGNDVDDILGGKTT